METKIRQEPRCVLCQENNKHYCYHTPMTPKQRQERLEKRWKAARFYNSLALGIIGIVMAGMVLGLVWLALEIL